MNDVRAIERSSNSASEKFAVCDLESSLERPRSPNRTLCDTYIDSVTGDAEPPGCFFAHISKEHRGDDPVTQQAIMKGIERMRGLVK